MRSTSALIGRFFIFSEARLMISRELISMM